MRGLYRPEFEHDACGIGFLANKYNQKSNFIVRQALELLINLEHRGGIGSEQNSGDGAGILLQIPHEYYVGLNDLDFSIPDVSQYATGLIFFPNQTSDLEKIQVIIKKSLQKRGMNLLGYRKIPINESILGRTSLDSKPIISQIFIQNTSNFEPDLFERKLYVLRRDIENQAFKINKDFYICSLSSRIIVYKGMLTTDQLGEFYPDLQDEKIASAMASVHSRFSTNTFPSWSLSQPFRHLCHNGEINTLRGNIVWMQAKEPVCQTHLFTEEEMNVLFPIINKGLSDSATLDSVVEFLLMSGRSIEHVMSILIPDAWEKKEDLSKDVKSFYEYYAPLMEPWDGPASIAFSDGKKIGSILDRNGLRPGRWLETKDGLVIVSSEAGAIDISNCDIKQKGRLKPGSLFLVDLENHVVLEDTVIKKSLSSKYPYENWIKNSQQKLKIPLKEVLNEKYYVNDLSNLRQRQQQFGYTLEDLKVILIPMLQLGKEPIGSMGADTPLAVLSKRSCLLFNYFHQLFAQVTNPPIDPIREKSVMSLMTFLGGINNILEDVEESCHVLEIEKPLLTQPQVNAVLKQTDFKCIVIDSLFNVSKKNSLASCIAQINKEVESAIDAGVKIVILSDKKADKNNAPIPSLLITSAVHNYLLKKGKRASASLIVESGEVREVHHFALLIGYGASAVHPYLVLETIADIIEKNIAGSVNEKQLTTSKAIENYITAIDNGLLKILSKMGVSTIRSYCGAQIFEAIGIGKELIDEYFPNTVSRIGGIDLEILEEETRIRHCYAYPTQRKRENTSDLDAGGIYFWRQRGETHLHSPMMIAKIQQACRENSHQLYKEFSNTVSNQVNNPLTIRGQFSFKKTKSIPIDEVEPAENILKRFNTGAMSYGSISYEAHTTLAIAMNRIGAKSNTGEGGEDPVRYKRSSNGDLARSAIKQVASGRFGVTSHYLVNSDEIQIKIAQGAKPGEGGQLPGHKVDKTIAKTRHSTEGVGLISPPPHHDIYSIEDLAQLIYDLKNANDKAKISVKLVSETGVGTVAAGVTKANADSVMISGAAGGTGASPLSSIRYAGLPWEMGLAETHQTLVKNNLRSRVLLQTDGMIRTGRDVAIATLLGAEEWGVATGALIVSGCIMMRKCHLNTCPVGIATQRKELRKLYNGKADEIVRYFKFIVQELREIMAQLGIRTINEMVGQTDLIKVNDLSQHWKANKINLTALLYQENTTNLEENYCCISQSNNLDKAVNYHLIEQSSEALKNKKKVNLNLNLNNTNRTVGTLLSAEISRQYGEKGLPASTIKINAKGSAGQSFMAFGSKGIEMKLEGEANDYFCKGLSGSNVTIIPPKDALYDPHKSVIIGNVAFYGATSGESYILGIAGERFCVRNSGVEVVVEGIGDHGCEYMTGGRVLVLGDVGRNFAAGMSGGIAYILAENLKKTKNNINLEMVLLEELLDRDQKWLQSKLKKYFNLTNSSTAYRVLSNFSKYRDKFIKIMPIDYKRVMEALVEK